MEKKVSPPQRTQYDGDLPVHGVMSPVLEFHVPKPIPRPVLPPICEDTEIQEKTLQKEESDYFNIPVDITEELLIKKIYDCLDSYAQRHSFNLTLDIQNFIKKLVEDFPLPPDLNNIKFKYIYLKQALDLFTKLEPRIKIQHQEDLQVNKELSQIENIENLTDFVIYSCGEKLKKDPHVLVHIQSILKLNKNQSLRLLTDIEKGTYNSLGIHKKNLHSSAIKIYAISVIEILDLDNYQDIMDEFNGKSLRQLRNIKEQNPIGSIKKHAATVAIIANRFEYLKNKKRTLTIAQNPQDYLIDYFVAALEHVLSNDIEGNIFINKLVEFYNLKSPIEIQHKMIRLGIYRNNIFNTVLPSFL